MAGSRPKLQVEKEYVRITEVQRTKKRVCGDANFTNLELNIFPTVILYLYVFGEAPCHCVGVPCYYITQEAAAVVDLRLRMQAITSRANGLVHMRPGK